MSFLILNKFPYKMVTKKKNILLVAIGGVLALAASVFVIKRKSKSATKAPPKNAPQMSINNPGSQAEFPTSPSESEIG
ncbi:MAG: ammonium transporter [Chitinophagaceae bacterium]|nr:ammonium transporter [Chitinophagaceae bacterium]